ncbi:ACDE family multidrug resistance protein [Halalkalibacter nanhaiisediminis]|uniref:ACDE family multidrug resistance protein n=2 Tax=Halalkalibacter nanhaiisediminis TaxID=688079 RepID=A0A562QLF6_9BACI|nr:ACDE family multidrug resistance protein [Halalkalibacter nanhaiisediminis]
MKQDKKTWDIISISSIPLVMTLGNSMLIPVLPEIEKVLGISSFQVSMLITVYSIVAIICIPIAGYLSDHIGRKNVIIPSLIIAAIGGLLSGFAAWQMENPYWILIIGRLLQGIGAAGAAPIVMPLVGDLYSDEKEVSEGLGMIETSNTLGKVLSPILGAALAMAVWYMPFFAFPIFCFISILLMLFLVKEPQMKKDAPAFLAFLQSLKVIFKREGRWLYAVFTVGGICMFVLFGVLFYLSTMLEETYQIVGMKKGILLAIPLAALCISSYATGKVIGEEKQKMKWLTVFGIGLLTIAVISVSFSKDIYLLLTALFVSGIGIGIALPSLDALVTEGIKMEQRGSITSFYSSMRFVGVALGPPVFALLMKTSHFFMFIANGVICLLALILVLIAIKPDEEVKATWS